MDYDNEATARKAFYLFTQTDQYKGRGGGGLELLSGIDCFGSGCWVEWVPADGSTCRFLRGQRELGIETVDE